MLHKGFFPAARKCLGEYSEYRFTTLGKDTVEGDSSKVDFVAMVDEEGRALVETKSPSVMKAVGEMLPPHGIHFTWPTRQPLVPRILSKVSTRFPFSCNASFEGCVGSIISGSEKDGVVVSHMPQ